MFLSLLTVLLLPPTPSPTTPIPHPPDSVVAMPEITITATRTSQEFGGPPLRVTVVGSRAIAQIPAKDVGSVLSARSGSFIRQYGAGGLANLSFRGAAPEQTLLLIDGQPLTDVQLGQVDLSLLPSAVLDRVEVVHGAGSALYGSAGMAGVVNLRTLPSAPGSSYSATVGAGAFGRRFGTMRLSQGAGRVSAAVTADLERADNDFTFESVVGGVPREMRRSGAGFDRGTIYATGEYGGSSHLLRLAAMGTTAKRGLPGPSTSSPAGERQWDDQLRVWLSDRVLLERGILRLRASSQWNTLRYLNPQLELDQTSHSSVYAFEVERIILRRASNWTIGSGADYGSARHPALATSARILHGAAFMAAALERIGAYSAIRLDAYEGGSEQIRVAFTPRVGLRRTIPRTAIEMYVGAGRAFRAPTLNERFWQPGGNPRLRPERGWSADAGLRGATRNIMAEVSVFASRQRDEIMWLRTNAGYYAPFNIRSTRSIGLETSIDVVGLVFRGLRAEGGARLTYTAAKDRSDPSSRSYGHQLRYVPREQLKMHATVWYRSVSAGTNLQYVGRRFVTTDGSQWVAPYWHSDVRITLRRQTGAGELEFSADLRNALNVRYHVVQYYPMPPRHLAISVSIRSSRSKSQNTEPR